jgi:ERI1 exoribonuclease 3
MKDYFLILDFESTCFDSPNRDNQKKPYEIIEMPTVILKHNKDNRSLDYVAEFQQYCMPCINSKLSDFCTQLTGITQETVNSAEIFPTVMQKHYKWLLEKLGDDVHNTYFVTCGRWDFETALKKELERWKNNKEFQKNNPDLYKFISSPPKIYWSFINIKDLFMSVYKQKAGGMVTMLNYLKLTLDGRHHSGLDDSKNTAKILQKIYTDAGDTFETHIKEHYIKHK